MTQNYEQLIHHPDGSLVSTNPYIVVGTRLKVVKKDEDWGEKWDGAEGIIERPHADSNAVEPYGEDGKPHHVWAKWTNKNDASQTVSDWFYPDSVEVVVDG